MLHIYIARWSHELWTHNALQVASVRPIKMIFVMSTSLLTLMLCMILNFNKVGKQLMLGWLGLSFLCVRSFIEFEDSNDSCNLYINFLDMCMILFCNWYQYIYILWCFLANHYVSTISKEHGQPVAQDCISQGAASTSKASSSSTSKASRPKSSQVPDRAEIELPSSGLRIDDKGKVYVKDKYCPIGRVAKIMIYICKSILILIYIIYIYII